MKTKLIDQVKKKSDIAVVIFHGLGGNFESARMKYLEKKLKEKLNNVFVYSARFGNTKLEDSMNSVKGNAFERVRSGLKKG